MTSRYLPRLVYVWCLTVYTVALAVVFCVALLLGEARQVEGAYIPALLVGLVLSLVLTHRRPENRIGPLLATIAAALISLGAANLLMPVALESERPTMLVLTQLLSDFGFGALFLGSLVLLPLWFPTGYAMSSGWAWVGRVAISIGLVSAVTLSLAESVCVYTVVGSEQCTPVENPWGIQGFSGFEDLLLVTVVTSLISLVSPIVRWRRSQGVERQQMKWFPLAVIGLLAQFVLSQDSVEASRWVVDIFHGFALLAVFASIAVPVLRYRLYDIDRFVSRTVTYSIVVGVLGGSVSLLATVVSVQFFEDPLVVAATTLTVAAVFNPLRRRVQRVVDRRFNRSRYDAERIMDDFAGTLQGEVDPGLVVDGWVIVVKETMEPATVGVWVR